MVRGGQNNKLIILGWYTPPHLAKVGWFFTIIRAESFWFYVFPASRDFDKNENMS